MKKIYLQFKNLKNQPHLIHGVFDKSFGNFSYKYNSKREIEKNLVKISKVLKINNKKIIMMRQVHGSRIRVLDNKSFRVLENKTIFKTDGLITNQKNVFLVVKTADCYPVILFDPVQKVVGVVHIGWRGAIEKIFVLAILKMVNDFRTRPKDMLIGIGPGIEACCFKHKKLFQEKLPEWLPYLNKDKSNLIAMDLRKFIQDQLVEAGIKKQNIETMAICTGCNKNFFSHYRALKTGEKEGRFATIIGMVQTKK